MHIAVAVNEKNLKAIIPEVFEESKGIMIIETDSMEIVDYKEGIDVDFMSSHGCEALICGEMYDGPLFEKIALNMISRYNGANYSARRATRKMLDYELTIITDYVGGTGCGGHGDVSNCATHQAEEEESEE